MVKIQSGKLFKLNHEALSSNKRYIVNEGGSRSGKSFSIMQLLITICINQRKTITVVSHSLPHLKRGALRDFDNIIRAFGWYREEWHNKTDNIYHFPNGSYIEFFGLEDADKARGAGRNILFINEANLISKQLFDQLDIRTTEKVIIDLNPSDFDSYCYQLADGDNAIKIHSTYKDNPFLSEIQKNVIESYKDADPMLWQVFGLGLRGVSEEQIYSHWKITDHIPEGEVCYGLDFGFRVPTALVKVTLAENSIFAEEILYQQNLTTGDLLNILPTLGINHYDEIFADAAEPKTIQEIYQSGFNVKAADKDVYAGIMKVKSQPLYIKNNSLNLLSEIKKYRWKSDGNGNVIDKQPVKLNDHILDALRYAVYSKSKQTKLTWGVL
jgi:phage terminase large subunit